MTIYTPLYIVGNFPLLTIITCSANWDAVKAGLWTRINYNVTDHTRNDLRKPRAVSAVVSTSDAIMVIKARARAKARSDKIPVLPPTVSLLPRPTVPLPLAARGFQEWFCAWSVKYGP